MAVFQKHEQQIECIKNLKRSIFLLIDFKKNYIPISFLVKCLQGGIPAILIILMQKIINMIQISQDRFNVILFYLVIYVGISIANNIIENLYANYNFKVSLEFSNYLKVKMLEKSLELELKDFENPETFDVINRAQNQDGNSILTYVTSFFNIVREMISMLSIIYILVAFCWQISVIILLAPIICCMFTIFIDKKWYKIRINRTIDERQKWYVNFLITTGAAIKEIKVFNLGGFFLKKFKKIQEKITKQDKKMYRKQTILEIICDFIEELVVLGSYIYILFLGYTKKILIGNVTAYIECVDDVKVYVQNIFVSLNNLIEESLYLALLFDFLDLHVENLEGNKKILKIKNIELKNVSYRHKQEKYILKNINMKIKNNRTIAIVGENGSGKTTLLKILLGLYTDYEGEIFINGINIKELDMKDYQKRLSVVFQDYIKYETSFRENIAIGNIELMYEDEKIKEIINILHLDHKLKGENDLDTVLGNWFGNEQLSLGEWQRIAIGRSLLRDVDIYLWDEPDSALDVLKYWEVIKLFEKVTKNKMGIYVSHKIGNIHYLANQIYVLKNGEIIEYGNHENLLEQKGEYYSMYKRTKEVN